MEQDRLMLDLNTRQGNTISATDSSTHSAHKRVVSQIYSKSYLQSSGAVLGTFKSTVKHRLLPYIEHFARGQKAVDVYSFIIGVRMDMIISYVFWPSNGTNFIEHENERNA